MTRAQWIVIGVTGVPTLVAATVVSATLGPLGAIAFGGILLAGLNIRHLFHTHRQDHE